MEHPWSQAITAICETAPSCPINLNESGVLVSSYVWTGSDFDGTEKQEMALGQPTCCNYFAYTGHSSSTFSKP